MRVLILIISTLMLTAFTGPQPVPSVQQVQYQLSVSLSGEEFSRQAKAIYAEWNLNADELNVEAFELALRGYFYMKLHGELENERFLTIIDYSLSSKKRRLWVLDMFQGRVLFHDLVAHGKYSGNEFAHSFSNRYQSKKSSIGFLKTGSIYNGRHRRSLKLHGQEYGVNHNAFGRGIVIHGAYYVHQQYVKEDETIGRSFGCPAVSQDLVHSLVDAISGGACVFHYYPDESYIQTSRILNSDLYVPMSEIRLLTE